MRFKKSLYLVMSTVGMLTLSYAQVKPGLDGLKEVPFRQLSQSQVSPLGMAALSIRPNDWKHAETENFVYHYFNSFIATPVSVEAEFYYRVISKDLDKDTSKWERKCHIFIFENPEDWDEFKKKGALDPWTGGLHAGNHLFIIRDPRYKWKGNTLGHEVAHLVIDRFYGSNVPLWLNEGYAEYVAELAYSSFHRARGYISKPSLEAVDPAYYKPVKTLVDMQSYPMGGVEEVRAFYNQSHRFVRFLSGVDRKKFNELLERMSKGSLFTTALSGAYGNRFLTADALDKEFREYATKDFTPKK